MGIRSGVRQEWQAEEPGLILRVMKDMGDLEQKREVPDSDFNGLPLAALWLRTEYGYEWGTYCSRL